MADSRKRAEGGGLSRFLKENSLSLFFGALFLGTIAAQSMAGQRAFNEEQRAHGSEPLSWSEYVTSPDFGQAVMENWQSEFLQFTLFILATIWLVQKGSNESKRLDSAGVESEQPIGMAAEAAARQVLVEAVRQLEAGAITGQNERGRHVDQPIVRLRQPQQGIV